MLKPNFTQIPNIILDNIMHTLSGAEIKVLMYLCRRTYGFQKSKDKISISQFQKGIKNKEGKKLDNGTGLSNKPIINALRRLEEIGIVSAERKNNKTSSYTLNLSYVESTQPKLVEKVHSTSGKSTQEVVEKVHTQKKEKESIQKKVTEQSSEVFSFEEEIRKNDENNNRALQVIGLFMKLRKDTLSKNITNKETYKVFLKRNMITAHSLKHFTDEQLVRASKKVKRDYSDIDWGLETILKTLIK